MRVSGETVPDLADAASRTQLQMRMSKLQKVIGIGKKQWRQGRLSTSINTMPKLTNVNQMKAHVESLHVQSC